MDFKWWSKLTSVEAGVDQCNLQNIKYLFEHDLYLENYSFPVKNLDQDLELLAGQDFVMPVY